MKSPNIRVFGWCPKHSKNLFLTRKQARRAGHIEHRMDHKQAYPCDVGPQRWHYGEVPPAVLYGLKTRSEVYNQTAA